MTNKFNISLLKNASFIAISEVTHFSKSSHKVHFELFKQLVKHNMIEIASSERLSVIDGLIINYCIDTKINLHDAYQNNYLSHGGLGFEKICRYIQKNNLSVKIIGFDNEYFHNKRNKHAQKIIKEITSPNLNLYEFVKKLDLSTVQNINANISKLQKNKNKLITETDKLIYDSLHNSLLDAYSIYANDWTKPATRNKVWYDNIIKHINKKIFINGFHFQLDEYSYGSKLKKLLGNKFISIGMSAYNIYHPRIEINDYPAPQTEEEYNASLTKKPIKITSGSVNKYYKPTKLEEYLNLKYKFKMFKSSSIKNKNMQTIRNFGSSISVFTPNTGEWNVPISHFDVIIFIKKSK